MINVESCFAQALPPVRGEQENPIQQASRAEGKTSNHGEHDEGGHIGLRRGDVGPPPVVPERRENVKKTP